MTTTDTDNPVQTARAEFARLVASEQTNQTLTDYDYAMALSQIWCILTVDDHKQRDCEFYVNAAMVGNGNEQRWTAWHNSSYLYDSFIELYGTGSPIPGQMLIALSVFDHMHRDLTEYSHGHDDFDREADQLCREILDHYADQIDELHRLEKLTDERFNSGLWPSTRQ